jgi:hypothetical protein
MGPAARAELFDGELFRLTLLVFGRRVIAPFTAVALKTDQISHFSHPGAKPAPI